MPHRSGQTAGTPLQHLVLLFASSVTYSGRVFRRTSGRHIPLNPPSKGDLKNGDLRGAGPFQSPPLKGDLESDCATSSRLAMKLMDVFMYTDSCRQGRTAYQHTAPDSGRKLDDDFRFAGNPLSVKHLAARTRARRIHGCDISKRTADEETAARLNAFFAPIRLWGGGRCALPHLESGTGASSAFLRVLCASALKTTTSIRGHPLSICGSAALRGDGAPVPMSGDL